MDYSSGKGGKFIESEDIPHGSEFLK